MKTLRQYVVNGGLYAGDGKTPATVGDQVRLYLDTEAHADFPEYIIGTVQHPVAPLYGGTSISYSFEYDEADLLDVVVNLIVADVISVTVTSAVDIVAEELDVHVGSGGTAHANVIAAGAAGFMTGADKTKLDGVTGTNTGDETTESVLALLGAGTPEFQLRSCGLRETLAVVYAENDVRRLLASFKIPKAYAVAGLYKIFVGGTMTVRVNGGEAQDLTSIGFVTDPNLPVGFTGAVYGINLTGLTAGSYLFHNFGDYISLELQDVGAVEDKLVLAGGFDPPQPYIKAQAGVVTSGSAAMEALGLIIGSPNYIENPDEDFMLHLVLDITAASYPPAPLSYLVGWDITVAGYVYQGL